MWFGLVFFCVKLEEEKNSFAIIIIIIKMVVLTKKKEEERRTNLFLFSKIYLYNAERKREKKTKNDRGFSFIMVFLLFNCLFVLHSFFFNNNREEEERYLQ